MEADKKPEETKSAAPADSADKKPAASTSEESKTDDGIIDATKGASPAGAVPDGARKEAASVKPPSAFKTALTRFRLYVLIVLLIVVIGAVFGIVSSLNGRKTPPPPSVVSQTLTQSELKQLAQSNTTVGNSGQTLTVQGNSEITGTTLIKGNLNVAGTIQSGSEVTLSQIKVSGTSNLGSAQISTLQVANSAAFQGLVTAQQGLDVAGNINFTGPVSAALLTTTNIVLTGSNSQIQALGHITFSSFPEGAVPGRQISFGVLGNGGSASIFGSDVSGTVNINTGNNPLPGCFITLIFNIPYTNMPNLLISPINIGAGETKYYTIVTTKSFKICTNNAAPANQAFAFDYFVGATPN